MEKKPVIDAEKIHLQFIEVQVFDIHTQAFKNSEKYQLAIGHRLLHNLEDKRLKIDLTCTIRGVEENEILRMDVAYHFEVEDLSDFYTTNEKGFPRFNGSLIATILGVSVSTLRGMLYERLASQGIANVIIPVVSPMKMLAKS